MLTFVLPDAMHTLGSHRGIVLIKLDLIKLDIFQECNVILRSEHIVMLPFKLIVRSYFSRFSELLKGKKIPLQARCGPEGGQMYSSTVPWPRHYKGVSGQQHARPDFTPRKDQVPIVQEAGRAQGPVWTGGISRPHWDSIPDRPVCSSVAIPTELPGPLFWNPKEQEKQVITVPRCEVVLQFPLAASLEP